MAKYIRDIIITLLAALAMYLVFQTVIMPFHVFGSSMLPTTKHNDYIMVNKVVYYFEEPKRGDIIVFHSPNNADTDLIKRVIGLPGDTIKVDNGKVYVNNSPLMEPYILESPKYKCSQGEVPPDKYFVLGDNRNNSRDSSHGWHLPRQNIIGKAWIIYWPPPHWMAIRHYPILAQK